MSNDPLRMRQVVDWSAALWAGLIAGAIFFILQLVLLPLFTGGSPWVVPHYIAAIVMGEGILSSATSFDLTVLLVAAVVHFALSIIYALVIAFILHRWGLLVGIIGGGLLGLALYLINFYTFTYFFPWFFPIRSWIIILAHIVFGALAGGIYEALERERFVRVDSSPAQPIQSAGGRK